jgi:hypothetical protein
MRLLTAILIVCASLAVVFHRASASLRATSISRPESPSPPPPPVAVCNNSALTQLWAHVYNPQRLLVRHACVRATGTIVLLRPEKDGDIHIQVKMDPRYQNLVAPGNSRQGGNLVVEPICTHKVTQPDAVASCAGFTFPVSVFPVGTHVGIRGPLVFDRHHGWSEIHPVEKMVRLP